MKTYTGKSLVRGYAKHFGVDKICAVRELRLVGVDISEEYEKQLKESMVVLAKQRQLNKQKREQDSNSLSGFGSDENFAFITGYTNGGVPFGITHEELENDKSTNVEDENIEDELPF